MKLVQTICFSDPREYQVDVKFTYKLRTKSRNLKNRSHGGVDGRGVRIVEVKRQEGPLIPTECGSLGAIFLPFRAS